ncbi:MAG: ribonuclease HII [Bacteroidota bacterium]
MLESYHTEGVFEAGCDEAGRGCIAGPVVAAAVILPAGYRNPQINDSKKLSSKTREFLRDIVESDAIAFGIGWVDEKEIDRINILNASILAMQKALEKLRTVPQHLIIDGNRFKPWKKIPYHCIIKGDSKYISIAAASILAKTYRDEYMETLHNQYPEYAWNNNMGYPTRKHREAVLKLGPTPYHRRSFRLLDEQMRLDFS